MNAESALAAGAARRVRRSALYVPASSARAIEKAKALPCDVVILDLEDSVPTETKAAARSVAQAVIGAGDFGSREAVVRVNAMDTAWFADDLAAAAAARPDAVLVPKIRVADDLVEARRALGPGVRLWAMIETCAAIARLDEIGGASAQAGVSVWVIGAKDLMQELGCPMTADRSRLLTFLSSTVAMARVHGLAVLDGVYMDLSDPEGLAAQAAQGAALGFDGKTAIHPSQLDTLNRAFATTPEGRP